MLKPVVFQGMQAKLFHLVLRNSKLGATLALRLELFDIGVRIRPEAAKFHSARSHGSFRIDNDGNPRLLMVLVETLRANINSGKPAAVARMRVVPAAQVLRPGNALAVVLMRAHVLVGLVSGVNSRLRTFYGETEGVHDIESVTLDLALHEPHDLDVSARLGVHDHLDQRDCGNLHAREMIRTKP